MGPSKDRGQDFARRPTKLDREVGDTEAGAGGDQLVSEPPMPTIQYMNPLNTVVVAAMVCIA